MKTEHSLVFENSTRMPALPDNSVDLVLTSPPYPMIEMWDALFSVLNPAIRNALNRYDGMHAFELMHRELDPTWAEVYRVLKTGGFACINIGDATRTLNGDFCLYPNHARILSRLYQLGFNPLPAVIWRKQTNAPNKFMGSGMLPAGAYVTLEHEYILILRKGAKREFITASARAVRSESAIFWEERNAWFSDVWFDIKGTRQLLGDAASRARSAAYPFELAYRLINMYSAKGDLVLDPFSGMGTSMAAAMSSGRNSVAYEIDASLQKAATSLTGTLIDLANRIIRDRIQKHLEFCADRIRKKGPMKHRNIPYGFPVVTAQEKALLLNDLIRIDMPAPNRFEVSYAIQPQSEFCKDWDTILAA